MIILSRNCAAVDFSKQLAPLSTLVSSRFEGDGVMDHNNLGSWLYQEVLKELICLLFLYL